MDSGIIVRSIKNLAYGACIVNTSLATEEMIEIRLRDAIKSYNERSGERLTYDELAMRTGLSKATLEAIGSRADYNPTISTIDSICSALDCPVSELLFWSNDRPIN